MRCCVEKRKGGPSPGQADPEGPNEALETTTKSRLRPVPPRTTIATTTTSTTTTRVIAIASDKQDKFGDYEYTDEAIGSDGNILTSDSSSRFSMTVSSRLPAFLVCTVSFFYSYYFYLFHSL